MELVSASDTPLSPSEILPTSAMPADVLLEPLMEYRRGQVRRREFRPLGIVEKVMIEASGVARTGSDNPLTHHEAMPASLDWMKKGPLLGVSNDGKDCLICSPMLHPPDIPDPRWVQPYPPKQWENGLPVLQAPPMLRQSLEDRAAGIFLEKVGFASLWDRVRSLTWRKPEATPWFVFQPVHQVLLLLQDRTGLAVIECCADAGGRHTALVFNPRLQEGHLLFGQQRVEIYRA